MEKTKKSEYSLLLLVSRFKGRCDKEERKSEKKNDGARKVSDSDRHMRKVK